MNIHTIECHKMNENEEVGFPCPLRKKISLGIALKSLAGIPVLKVTQQGVIDGGNF